MMAVLLPVMAHFGIGLAILGGNDTALANSAAWFDGLEGVRRVGTATYHRGPALPGAAHP